MATPAGRDNLAKSPEEENLQDDPNKRRKKREVISSSGDYVCRDCIGERKFQSLHALWGHMKVHAKEKPARGAIPYPALTRASGSSSERGSPRVADAEAVQGATRRFEIDLNLPPMEIDLNNYPPPEKNYGYDGKDNMEHN